MIAEINTVDDVRTFIREVKAEGLGDAFHPDDGFAGYVNMETNKPMYGLDAAWKRDDLLNKCFEVCEAAGMDIYDICLELVGE